MGAWGTAPSDNDSAADWFDRGGTSLGTPRACEPQGGHDSGGFSVTPSEYRGTCHPAGNGAQAAAAAILALLFLDQTPANSPRITGVEVPRVLGRLTPGSPTHWNALLREVAGGKGAIMSLRSAL
jgi:hypothetical protein